MDITMDYPYIQNPENIMTPHQLPKTLETNEKSQQTKLNDEEVLKKNKQIIYSTEGEIN